MRTANDRKRTSPDGVAGGGKRTEGRTVSTKARTRCRPKKSTEESLETDVAAAMPQILQASVKKAKQGSLVHTKWLWGVVEKMPKENGAKTSLAELLMGQLSAPTCGGAGVGLGRREEGEEAE